MPKNKKPLHESNLIIAPATFPSTLPIVDTHTHLASTYGAYKRKFPNGRFGSIHEFVKGVYGVREGGGAQSTAVEAIVDVWCEAPPERLWRELADSALSEEGRARAWGGMGYYFVMGGSLLVLQLSLMVVASALGGGLF
jgi:TatD DNase family protein